MNAAHPSIRARLEEVQARIAEAAMRSGRVPGEVRLVGVAKNVPPGTVREAVEAGLTDVGENRVQEARRKIENVGRDRARWHLVGHLQRNKAARAVDLFDRIHSVDDLELARTLSRHAVVAGRQLVVLIQVNTTGKVTQHGVPPSGLERLLEEARALPGLAVDGLMTIAPLEGRGETARVVFEATRELRDRAARVQGWPLPELSMGMSGDYEIAIEEGSTMVRVGTALFGPRDEGRVGPGCS